MLKKEKNLQKKSMLAEFEWATTSCLGVLMETGKMNELINNSSNCPLVSKIFGSDGLLSGFKKDHEWLEVHLSTQEEEFPGFIWYPASFEFPENQIEPVLISCTSNKLRIFSMDHDEIKWTKLNKNKLKSMGFDVFPKSILAGDKLYEYTLKYIKSTKSEKCINKRKIYYFEDLKVIESYIEFNPIIYLKIKESLHCEEIELWNAFISFVPVGTTCLNQVVHRDCLYDSISIFFYLDDSNIPMTQFYPMSHRLLSSVQDGFSKPHIPELKTNDILMMDGKLFHGGLKGTPVNRNRMLYVFQYRDKREKRTTQVKKMKFIEQLAQKDSFPTIFKIK